MASFARATDLKVIASGGTAGLDDLRALLRVAPVDDEPLRSTSIEQRAQRLIGVEGVIVGQALYSGAFTLEEALQAAEPVAATTSVRGRRPRYCEG
jgi:phosphoribosylformimino-5-aminoimidazole carboxamide ribonucleotide (ProFAR) isomerase